MNEFFEVFSLVLIALCIVNLISSIYPSTKNKHTLMVVFSVISVYICITPVSAFLNSVRDMKSFSVDAVLEDFEEDSVDFTYTEELKSILTQQIEAEIEGEFKGVETEVVLETSGISGNISGEKAIENGGSSGNGVLEIAEISVFGADEEREAKISEFIEKEYGIKPFFTGNP